MTDPDLSNDKRVAEQQQKYALAVLEGIIEEDSENPVHNISRCLVSRKRDELAEALQ